MERTWVPSKIICITSLTSIAEKTLFVGYKLICYIVAMGDTSWMVLRWAVMRWSVMSGPQLYITLMLYINCGITLVMVNDVACLTCLSSVLETTCSIERLIPCASMLKVIKMVACLTFTGQLLDISLLSSSHSCGRQVRYGLSHFR